MKKNILLLNFLLLVSTGFTQNKIFIYINSHNEDNIGYLNGPGGYSNYLLNRAALVQLGTSDLSLHITSSSQVYPGATYDAGSQGNCVNLPGLLFCTTTNMAAVSPNINTAGAHNLVLQYDFIGNGQDTTDNGSSDYSINGGTNFTSLDASLKSSLCGARKGVWTTRGYNLPLSCNNIANFKMRFRWTNDDDAAGADPSVAINNVLLRDSLPGAADSIVKTVTLTLPAGPHFVTAALSIVSPGCGQQNGSINNMGVAGGTPNYTLIWKTGGAQIGTGNSITNIGAGTYTFEVTDAGGCVIDTTFTVVTGGSGGSSAVATNKQSFCANDSTQICVTDTFTTYLWNTGANTQCITVKLAGNYYVTVTDHTGCTATSNHLAITVFQLPPVSISVNGDTLTAHNASTYQWYRNGNLINGATDSSYIVMQGGIYTVVVSDINGCEATSNGITISGIAEMENTEHGIRISPNPVAGDLNILADEHLIGKEMLVTDAVGKILVTEGIKDLKTQLHLGTSLSNGLYFLRIGDSVQRFIKF